MNIAHITDLHITEDGALIRDVGVREHFRNILADVRKNETGLMVLGGDLAAERGEIASYHWIKKELDKTGIPYLITAGNHDIFENLQSVFNISSAFSDMLCYRYENNGRVLFALDSSSRVIADEQLDWIKREAKDLSKPALLFMHHPPVFCNCAFMDRKYPLDNRTAVFDVLTRLPSLPFIFCGHYHTEKTVITRGKTIFLTPSTMLQIDQNSAEYEVHSRIPGYRMIQWDGSTLKTTVHYR